MLALSQSYQQIRPHPPHVSAWSVKTRRAPSRHCRCARVCVHTTTAMHDMSTRPLSHKGCMQLLLNVGIYQIMNLLGGAFRRSDHQVTLSKTTTSADTAQHKTIDRYCTRHEPSLRAVLHGAPELVSPSLALAECARQEERFAP